jgi:hypothetical protein
VADLRSSWHAERLQQSAILLSSVLGYPTPFQVSFNPSDPRLSPDDLGLLRSRLAMNDPAKKTLELDFALLTPPSSPRKRASLWDVNESPLLPPSPRKYKSCILPNLCNPSLLTPPASPTRSQSGNWLTGFPSLTAGEALTRPSIDDYDPIKSRPVDHLPIKTILVEPSTIALSAPPSIQEILDPVKFGCFPKSFQGSTITTRSLSLDWSFTIDGATDADASGVSGSSGKRTSSSSSSGESGENHELYKPPSHTPLTRASPIFGSTDSSILDLPRVCLGTSFEQECKTDVEDTEDVHTLEIPCAQSEPITPFLESGPFSDTFSSPNRTRLAMPLRHSSSPLRPSQWVARGGLLSPPRIPTRASDRFIPQRRPQISTRESFHLNKPTQASVATPDPFSTHLRRSGRLNEELRTLRETHSVITGRVSRSRARIGIRASSTGVNRQVSNGAVWNVGGSSAATDTVVGIPNGRGGLLGSGTNAPLYTSMFLSRSDPEAELETHEQRLALAFDVDQSNKVLSIGSASPVGSPSSSSNDSKPESSRGARNSKHVWHDSAWTKEGSTSRLFS